MTKEIMLANGQVSVVSDDDFDALSKWKWKMHPQGYASRTSGKGSVLMHRSVAGAVKGEEVHHLNGDKLDNRRENLQVVNISDHRMHHAPALVAFQKAHQVYPDKKRCVECGAEFVVNPRKRKRNICCSRECAIKRSNRAMVEARQAKAALREPNRCACGAAISYKAKRCGPCYHALRNSDGTFSG